MLSWTFQPLPYVMIVYEKFHIVLFLHSPLPVNSIPTQTTPALIGPRRIKLLVTVELTEA